MRLILMVACVLLAVAGARSFHPAMAQPADPGQPASPAAASFLASHRIVSYYGTPLAPGLGVLGQGSPEEVSAWLREQADAYAALDPERPVQPAFHLIYAVAQDRPGADGLYLGRASDALVEQYIELARENGFLLFLDIQMGRSTIGREVGGIARFLAEPHVHLALDPEFAWGPGVTPVSDIGYLTAAQVNEAQSMLQGIAREHALPGKILIVHQFRSGMLPDKGAIDRYDGIELVIDMDGFGPPAAKLATYDAVITRDAIGFPGIKLFYEYDAPLLMPEEVLALTPRPVVVIYQ